MTKVNLLSSSSVLLFFLLPEVSDNKPRVKKKGGWGTTMLFSQLMHKTTHKVNILSLSSVLLFFLPPEVSDNKPGMDGGK